MLVTFAVQRQHRQQEKQQLMFTWQLFLRERMWCNRPTLTAGRLCQSMLYRVDTNSSCPCVAHWQVFLMDQRLVHTLNTDCMKPFVNAQSPTAAANCSPYSPLAGLSLR
jgi:hypothetical protein